MKVIFSVLDRYDLWPHFHKHYKSQGVNQFVCLSYGPQLPGAFNIDAKLPVNEFTGVKDAQRHNEIIFNIVKHGEWFVIADLDEFAVVPGMTLFDAVQQADYEGANHIYGSFYDRVTADGTFPAQLEDDIWKQFPFATNATEVICRGCPGKLVAVKGQMPVSGGHHTFDASVPQQYQRPWRVLAQVHHFKWWGADPEKFFWNRFDEEGLYREELERFREHFRKHGRLDLNALKIYE